MKIAYISSSYFPSPRASTVQVMMMCQAMAGLGHDVTLAIPKSQNPNRKTQLQAHYGVGPTLDVLQVPRGNWRGGSTTFQIRSLISARLGRDGVCYARGRDYLAPLIALAIGRRAIFEVHGMPASGREADAVRRIAASPRGRLVVISNALRERYTNLQSPISNFIVAPDGVDLRRFAPSLSKEEARRLCGLPLDRPLVVYVGGLYAGRGLEELFAAMRGMPAALVAVGGRNDDEVARFRALALDCGAEALFVGYRPPPEVPRYLYAADVLAMPYAARVQTPGGEDTAGWMSPLKMFEYMAAGRPIVATDLPALREVLRHESNALLAAPGSADSLREQINRLLTDTMLAERIGRQARADVEAHTWEKRAEKILIWE